jgi:hypothetical protein
MKSFLFSFLIIILNACARSEYVVESDYSYHGNFKKYKTFAFMKHSYADKLTSQNSPVIEEEIKFRMKILGYEYNDSKPDLLLIFKIFENNLNFKGYDQPEFKTWVATEDTTKDYKPTKYELLNGTLLVLINDRKRRTTVWQGYASAIKSETSLVNPRSLKSSVISIFDRYEVFANALKKQEEEE